MNEAAGIFFAPLFAILHSNKNTFHKVSGCIATEIFEQNRHEILMKRAHGKLCLTFWRSKLHRRTARDFACRPIRWCWFFLLLSLQFFCHRFTFAHLHIHLCEASSKLPNPCRTIQTKYDKIRIAKQHQEISLWTFRIIVLHYFLFMRCRVFWSPHTVEMGSQFYFCGHEIDCWQTS